MGRNAMIKTQLTRDDAFKILELGKQIHDESRFHTTDFDAEKCWSVLDATVRFPNKFFIAYDDQFKGFIIMAIQEHYWSHHKWASDLVIYVVPEHRGSSLAFRLVKAAEKWATECGAQEMTILHNTEINTDAGVQFFNGVGYRTVGNILTKDL